MITVAGDFHSASTLLLPDRVEDDDFKDGFAKVLLLLRNEAPMAHREYRSPKSQTIVDMNYTKW